MRSFDAVSYFISPLFARSLGLEDIRHLRASVVTQLCLDYGMIDDAIYFTSEEVLGGVPLKEGDLVNCTAVRDRAHSGWKALRVTIDILFRSSCVFCVVLDQIGSFFAFLPLAVVEEADWTLRSSAMKARKQNHYDEYCPTRRMSSCNVGGEECWCLGGRREHLTRSWQPDAAASHWHSHIVWWRWRIHKPDYILCSQQPLGRWVRHWMYLRH